MNSASRAGAESGGSGRGSRREGAIGSSATGAVRFGALLLGGILLSGCATKRDLRDLQTGVREQAAADTERLEGTISILRDSLRVQAEADFTFRGQVLGQLFAIQEQLVTIQELTGQNQRISAELRDQIEDARSALFAPPSPGGGFGIGGDTLAAPVMGPGGGDDLFDLALVQLERGSWATARRAFEEFVTSYPSHPRAPDARYHLADLLVREERWEEAVTAFNEIPQLHPASPRVPEALYRIGLAQLQLENEAAAREAFNRVITGYPESGVAQLAREALAGIR